MLSPWIIHKLNQKQYKSTWSNMIELEIRMMNWINANINYKTHTNTHLSFGDDFHSHRLTFELTFFAPSPTSMSKVPSPNLLSQFKLRRKVLRISETLIQLRFAFSGAFLRYRPLLRLRRPSPLQYRRHDRLCRRRRRERPPDSTTGSPRRRRSNSGRQRTTPLGVRARARAVEGVSWSPLNVNRTISDQTQRRCWFPSDAGGRLAGDRVIFHHGNVFAAAMPHRRLWISNLDQSKSQHPTV